LDAIEQAAGEAAKAAALASLEREAEALKEAQRWRLEAEIRQETIKATKKAGIQNAIIAGLICFLGGFVVGGTLSMRNEK
jgi:F0F1-type ATP synthase delta subunit